MPKKENVCLCGMENCPGCHVIGHKRGKDGYWYNIYDRRDGTTDLPDLEERKRHGLPEDPTMWWEDRKWLERNK